MGKKYEQLYKEYSLVLEENIELKNEIYELRKEIKDATFEFEPWVGPKPDGPNQHLSADDAQMKIQKEQAERERDRLIEFAKSFNLEPAINKVLKAIEGMRLDADRRAQPKHVETPEDRWLKSRTLEPWIPKSWGEEECPVEEYDCPF